MAGNIIGLAEEVAKSYSRVRVWSNNHMLKLRVIGDDLSILAHACAFSPPTSLTAATANPTQHISTIEQTTWPQMSSKDPDQNNVFLISTNLNGSPGARMEKLSDSL